MSATLTVNATELVIDAIKELGLGERDTLTLYELSKVINKASNKNVPSQMMYNYQRQGYIEVIEVDGKKRVTAGEALRFAIKYVDKNFNFPTETASENTN